MNIWSDSNYKQQKSISELDSQIYSIPISKRKRIVVDDILTELDYNNLTNIGDKENEWSEEFLHSKDVPFIPKMSDSSDTQKYFKSLNDKNDKSKLVLKNLKSFVNTQTDELCAEK